MKSGKFIEASPSLKPFSVVLDAAYKAGGILREAFSDIDGPEGTQHHALCDEEAENLIRERLIEAYPSYGYLGEETGYREPAQGCDYLWIVDPNDGTSAFMRGFRGSAVSIALLRNDDPIFGVVYAHNYPDDAGDMIAWSVGGPLVRNGQAIQSKETLSQIRDQVVIVSQSADRNPSANLDCVAPRRYRSISSIAYRLALVAAGDGVAGVSMATPTSWDLAAGHALLRGANHELFDETGAVVTYSREGLLNNPPGRLVIGGDPHICKELLQRDWGTVLERNRQASAPPYQLVWPESGLVENDSARLSRAQGCLLGQLCGDALGSQGEFMSARQITERFPAGITEIKESQVWGTLAGQPTDDSEMALLLARSIIQNQGYASACAFDAYRYWFDSNPFDIGNTIRRGLSGQPDIHSQANGALMRISPLGIFGALIEEKQLASWAREDAALTHPHPVCQDINMLYVLAIAEAVRTQSTPASIYDKICRWGKDLGVNAEVSACIERSATEPPSDYESHAGWVLIAFQNSLWQLLHSNSVASALIDTVARGGDTDTNAAIAGALLGAVHGVHHLPKQWREMVLTCRPIEGFDHAKEPRPEPLWPVDSLVLAEHLVLAAYFGERDRPLR